MSDIAIRVENLSKLYRIGSNGQRHDTLRDAVSSGLRGLASLARRPARRGHGPHPADDAPSSMVHRPSSRPSDTDFWALRDVSFEVKRGEVVGVIGRNGAGKSTLLKILSRITEPTSGRAEIHGRVGSLLEVGTGFHPELTGRENIYLNGAILGMKRAEIDAKFDEIVAFAEIDRFLDTPVKRYSSGMYVRLAFAVAAHLEPEILLVDEVLSVGDAAFQKKCLGKMGDVAGEGRTVLFVSHNMEAVSSLTRTALLLSTGAVSQQGRTSDVVSDYLRQIAQQRDGDDYQVTEYHREAVHDVPVYISHVWAEDRDGQRKRVFAAGDTFVLRATLTARERVQDVNVSLALKNSLGQRILQLFSLDQGLAVDVQAGDVTIAVAVRGLPLAPGTYYCDIGINRSSWTKAYDVVQDLPLFEIKLHQEPQHWANRPYGALLWDNVVWESILVESSVNRGLGR